jgi:hypothetical protein
MANNEERWRELCALAAVEQDPRKLMSLVREISHLLDLRDQRRAHEGDVEDGEPDATQTTGS